MYEVVDYFPCLDHQVFNSPGLAVTNTEGQCHQHCDQLKRIFKKKMNLQFFSLVFPSSQNGIHVLVKR